MNQEQYKIIKEWIERGMMFPSYLLKNKEVYNLIKESGNYRVPSLEQLKEAIHYLEIEYDDLHLTTNPFTPYVFSRGYVYVDIASLDKAYLEAMGRKEVIQSQLDAVEKYLEEGDYVAVVALAGKKYALNIFHDLYEGLRDEDKYPLFKEVYTDMEYGFDSIQPQILDEVLTLNFNQDFKKKLHPNKDGYVTVYRGEGTQSRPLERAYSWTTDKKVARFFATRFGEKGKEYQGKVHIDHVIDYINDRNEHEILVLPQHVIEVKEIPQM